MSRLQRIRTIWDALLQLGLQSVSLAGLYRFGLMTGHYRRLTPIKDWGSYESPGKESIPIAFLRPSPDQLRQAIGNQIDALILEANELISGEYRLFGGPPQPLHLNPTGILKHWTEYETGHAPWGVEDVKFIWEPARLGWAITLARAFHISGNEKFSAECNRLLSAFLSGNPPQLGPNWASAQEVALRIIALGFASAVMPGNADHSLDPSFAVAIAAHAERIPPTLVYGRAQNNNHLLSEGVGLYTAGVLLPHHPHAARWRKLGWRWANHCFQKQIAADGTYVQHSTNYHRMLLQLALWFKVMVRQQGEEMPTKSTARLKLATEWLIARLDPISGKVPNLGHNDGGYILPLACCGFDDYRPVAQAASRAFLGAPCLPNGAWDEMSLWLGEDVEPDQSIPYPSMDTAAQLILRGETAWGSLRAIHYTTRPGQSDQLHFDLWWRGKNIALDPGTYQYNAAPPWENALAGSAVHNTVMIEYQDPMRRAGRFLWLDWAQGFQGKPATGETHLGAYHEGYSRRYKILHFRDIDEQKNGDWIIKDQLLPQVIQSEPLAFTLHWLLPDYPYNLDQQTLNLTSPFGQIMISVACKPAETASIQLIRAGKVLIGEQEINSIFGWYSPTYGVRLPALALRIHLRAVAPVEFVTLIQLG